MVAKPRSKGQIKFLLATKPKAKKMQPNKKGNPKQVQKAQGYQAAVARRMQQSQQTNSKQTPPQKTPPTPPMPGS